MNLNVKQNTSKLAYEGACGSTKSTSKTTLSDAISKVALGTVMGAALITPVPAIYAADNEEAIEEVVVTGIRGSLKKSLDRKRYADGIVDAINAEDIGQFPDTNLAESLQRVTGVSISRDRGEGEEVTVRGLGPRFNLVTLNGRQLPTENGNERSFNFANLASEGISAVEVYKTSNANISTGGLGATINIITNKPLDNPGLKASAGLKLLNDSSTTEGSDISPELSGIYSNTFADDTIGIAVTASYQERDHGVNTATVNGWHTFAGDGGTLPFNDDQTNRPGEDDVYSVPQVIGYELAEFNRERTNAQLTLQWQPTDAIRTTLDYTYAEHELTRSFNNLSAWFNFGGQVSTYTDGPIASPILYSEFNNAGDFAMGTGSDAVVNEIESTGFNVQWDINDRLGIELDYHDSSSSSLPNSIFGSSSVLGLASFTRSRTLGHFEADLPVLQLALDSPLSADDVRIAGSVFTNDVAEQDINQFHLSGDFQIADNQKVDFGVQLTNVDNRSANSNVQRNSWGSSATIGGIADLLTPASIANSFDQISGGDDPRLQTDFFSINLEDAVQRVNEQINAGIITAEFVRNDSSATDCPTGLCASNIFTTDRRTQEDSLSIYAQYKLELSELDFNIGLRYERTDVSSQALVPSYNEVVWVANNELNLIAEVDGNGDRISDFTSQEADYDVYLPNVSVKYNFSESVIGRLAYSKTIARAGYESIQGGVTVDTLARIDGGTGSSGDPSLQPLESENIDLSIEWYYAEGSYASIGYFRKDVSNFVGTGSGSVGGSEAFPDLTTPVNGDLYQQAEQALGGTPSAAEVRQYILANFADQPNVDVTGVSELTGDIEGRITGVSADPIILFDLVVPVNNRDALLTGYELAIQHTFGETGFGIIANATIVDSNIAYNNFLLEDANQFAIFGASDSANLIGFYDKNGLQARIAYNWRDDFLAGNGQNNVGAGNPTYTEAYGQWDLSVSYDITENLSVALDGINIADETIKTYGRDVRQVLSAAQTGPRYSLGVRYNF